MYDRYGMKGLQEGGGENPFSPFAGTGDIFSDLFGGGGGPGGMFFGGGGGGRGGRRQRVTEDVVKPLK